MTVTLDYRDSDGATQTLDGCSLSQDKAGRYWLWSSQLNHNLAYKIKTKEDCLLVAIDSLLFTIELRDKRIAALQRITTLAEEFADQIKPDEQNDI